MPHVATSPADLLERHPPTRPISTATGSSSTTRPPSATTAIRDLAWTAAFSDRRGRRPPPPSGSSGRPARRSAPSRRASRSCTRPAAAARSRASPSRPSTSARRPSTWRGPSSRRPRPPTSARSSSSSPAASRPTRSSARSTTRRSVLAGAIAAGWRGPGLHPGRPLPVQRQEVRGRPRGDDRGDPARLPPGRRGRLSQHRHRLLDPRRPLEADRRRAAARELQPGGRADGAHPDARGGRRDDQRRRRDRRGRDTRTRRSRSCGRTSTATAASSTRARPARPASPRSASRPARATAACRSPTAAWPRSSSTSRSCASSATSPASYGLAGAVQHGASTLPDELFHRFPAVETAEIHLATGLPERALRAPGLPRGAPPRDRGLVLRQRRRRAQGRPDRPAVRVHDPQEGDRAVQAPALGPRRPRTRSSPPSAARSRSCSPSSASTARARWSAAYIRPVEVHRPLPDALREAVASRADRRAGRVVIRPERPGDAAAIRALIDAAFAPSTEEGRIVDDLRAGPTPGSRTLALVAVDEADGDRSSGTA